ncbi:MAG: D-aminoacyl-tRNA deacylase [Candidatus Diapherotrites archaeon]|nr:D-aminoacyl-tRNA deacylase [Candidatus Diapherotrites archaeon]
MHIAIIVSKQDLAGLTIKQALLELVEFKETKEEFDGNSVFEFHSQKFGLEFQNFKLYTINEFQVIADYVNKISADLFVFASKHASAKGIPSLTVHSIGNFGLAQLGGKENTICPTSAIIQASYLKALQKAKNGQNLAYEITMEATHHGPFLTKPSVFIELGSNETAWQDPLGGQIIAQTILETDYSSKQNKLVAIALGGNHYCSSFNKLVLEKNYAIAFVCPKHGLTYLTKDLLSQMIVNTQEPVTEILIDSKSLGTEKPKVLDLLDQLPNPKPKITRI